METLAAQPSQERLNSFDPLASVNMLRYDLRQFGQVLPETRQRVCDEQLSYLAEGVDQAARTTFVMKRVGGELMYFNKGEWSSYEDMLRTGLEVAEVEAVADPRRDFLVGWAEKDIYHGRQMRDLQPGQQYFWYSRYPYEEERRSGAAFLQKDCGLHPSRQMGFLYRTSCRDDGCVVLESQTVDRSNDEAFANAMQAAENTPGANLDIVTRAYDDVLEQELGGTFNAGRRDNEQHKNVWEQIQKNRDLVVYFLDELEAIARQPLYSSDLEERNKKLVYGVWALFSKRIEDTTDALTARVSIDRNGNTLSRVPLAKQVESAFDEFAAAGKILAACGGSIDILQGEKNILNASAEEVFKATFGIIDLGVDLDRDNLGSRHFKCNRGHTNYRRKANVPEKVCQTAGCGESVEC